MLAALHRAEVALVLGDAKGARKGAREALDHARKHGDEKAAAKARWAHVIALKAALAEGNIEDAEKTLATIDAAAGDDDHFKSAVHFAHGSVAAAKGDIDEARAHFDKVMGKSPLRFEGRVHLANALAKAGKTDEAQKLRAELAATYRRDFYHVAIQKGLRSES
jgi:predicted Zn-dependent protease